MTAQSVSGVATEVVAGFAIVKDRIYTRLIWALVLLDRPRNPLATTYCSAVNPWGNKIAPWLCSGSSLGY